jgi:hypothetical protein
MEEGAFLPRGVEEGACCLFFNPFLLSGSLFTCELTPQYQQRSFFTLQDLLPSFGMFQARFSHLALYLLP